MTLTVEPSWGMWTRTILQALASLAAGLDVEGMKPQVGGPQGVHA